MRFNAADSVARKSFIGNESAYSSTANSAGNDTFTEKTTQNALASSENWNEASKIGSSHSSVYGIEGNDTGINTNQNSSKNHVRVSGQTKPMPTPEQEEAARLERMNANYEHDKAVLAKADPMFARNQFWDVGHAEGSGEVFSRNIKNKFIDYAADKEVQDITDESRSL